MGALSDMAALGAILARIAQTPSTTPPRDLIESRDCVGKDGCDYDLYEPKGPRRATVIALHGLTVHGRHDSRIIHFARSLAQSGVACAVPTLPRLTCCEWHPSDVEKIANLCVAINQESGIRPGIIGFSFGASYALLAACHPAVAKRLRFVVSFGAYHCLSKLVESHSQIPQKVPQNDQEWDDLVYFNAVLAWAHRERLELSPDATNELNRLLDRFCDKATITEKREIYNKHLKQLLLPEKARSLMDDELLEAVSPKGKLSAISCPVSLIHDRHDGIIPTAHATAIYEELRRGSDPKRHKLLVTSLLSHVNLSDALRLGDFAKLWAALSPIVSAGD